MNEDTPRGRWRWPHSNTVLCRSVAKFVQLFATAWTVAHQPPLFMGLSRQEYWSGLPFPFPGDLPNPGIKPTLLAWEVILYHWATGKPNAALCCPSATWTWGFHLTPCCHPHSNPRDVALHLDNFGLNTNAFSLRFLNTTDLREKTKANSHTCTAPPLHHVLPGHAVLGLCTHSCCLPRVFSFLSYRVSLHSLIIR